MLRYLSSMQKTAVYISMMFFLVFMIILMPMKPSTQLFMFVPLVSVILTMLLTGELFTKPGWKQLGLHRFPAKTILIAFLVPLIPIILGYVVVWSAGLADFGVKDEYTGQELYLFVGFFISLITSSLTVTLGEEIGWRGYLAEKMRALGLAKGLLLNGFIWGTFHMPIMLFTDIYHSNVNLTLFIPMFMITITLVGAFMTYLKYITGSVWPAVIAHSAHNVMWNYGELYTQNPDSVVPYITGDAGVVLIVFYLLLFMWILKRGKRKMLNG